MRLLRNLCVLLMALLLLGIDRMEVNQEDSSADMDIAENTWPVPPQLSMRVRVVTIKPESPSDLEWRWGGEGMGGKVQKGVLAKNITVGEWSSLVSVTSMVGSESAAPRIFLTFLCGQPGKRMPNSNRPTGYSRDVVLEFQFYDRQELLKSMKEPGPNGGTIGIVIPLFRLEGGRSLSDRDFLMELGGLSAYSRIRLEQLESLPWAGLPVPKRYAIISSLGGYGHAMGYGIRTTDPETMKQELDTFLQLGVNGLRDVSESLNEILQAGYNHQFRRVQLVNTVGFPVPGIKDTQTSSEAGCPFGAGVAARTRQDVARAVQDALSIETEEVWARTIDEIGLVIDQSPEGKKHPSVCPTCIAAFRRYLQKNGLNPKDFGERDWAGIKPVDVSVPRVTVPRPEGLLGYHTARFNNYATAQLFTTLRDSFERKNQAKRTALEDPETRNSKIAKQPWIYSFALRGDTFLSKGHSLDFFDFYRYSDNAFVYETSNRDPRVWSWDSYLCDVARVVSKERDIQFGVYVKPHRGAPLQRALSAISRGAKMIYWYTYGPDWSKGDSFAGEQDALAQVSKAGRLIAKAEPLLYGSNWVQSARIAIIKPQSSETWFRLSGRTPERTAAWENAKWIYTALAHAHLAVDALDEDFLDEVDLSQYDVMYISGPNLKTTSAQKIAAWVHEGGILYASGWSLVADEANQPMKFLQTLLGLKTRSQPSLWSAVKVYEGVGLETFGQPQAQVIPIASTSSDEDLFPGNLSLRVGREVLNPHSETKVLARFQDGGAAITKNEYGKGLAYTLGFFPGLEYSAGIRNNAFNMATDFDETVRSFIIAPAQKILKPIVQPDQATVEGQLVQNASSGKRGVILMNWTYRSTGFKRMRTREADPLTLLGRKLLPSLFMEDLVPVAELVPFENLIIKVQFAEHVRMVRSLMLNREIPFTTSPDQISIQLPRLEEADVLVFE